MLMLKYEAKSITITNPSLWGVAFICVSFYHDSPC
jgi:hypothetical protein